jgi:GT2 family glycosyltransferase
LKKVTVVIPNWNGKELLEPCLVTLYRQEFQDFETIVVDNGSIDGSVSFLQECFPQVRVIRFENNAGFSAAVNAGILAAEGSYVALLNNDTEVHPLWLKQLVEALEADPQAGSAASKILFFSDSTSVNSAGDEFSFFGVAYQRRLRPGDSDLFNDSRYVFSACGAAALYRKALFATVGLFDEAFFAYQEDVDLGFRAQLAGYRCLFVPKAVVYHKYRRTSSKMPEMWFYLRERNKYFVLIKNLPASILLISMPLIVLHEAMCLAEAVWRRQLWIYCKARKGALSHLPHMLRRRQQVQTLRVVSNTYLTGLMHFKEPLRILFSRFQARGEVVRNSGNHVERQI